MTRKHFEALALALKNARPVEIIPGGPADTPLMRNTAQASHSQWRADVRAIAEVLHHNRPLFDYVRFYAACGYETTEGVKS